MTDINLLRLSQMYFNLPLKGRFFMKMKEQSFYSQGSNSTAFPYISVLNICCRNEELFS